MMIWKHSNDGNNLHGNDLPHLLHFYSCIFCVGVILVTPHASAVPVSSFFEGIFDGLLMLLLMTVVFFLVIFAVKEPFVAFYTFQSYASIWGGAVSQHC
jgi:hypothetical protein